MCVYALMFISTVIYMQTKYKYRIFSSVVVASCPT